MHRSPWPTTAARDADGVLTVGGVGATDLAAEHGTPLWVVDEDDLRARCRGWREAYGQHATVAYAAKAWCATGILQIVADEQLWVDVVSGGELHTAQVAGVPPERMVFHGNNKSPDELAHAVDAGVGRIVLDSLVEIERLQAAAAERGATVPVWIRVTPGIDAHTHEYVRTGHDDSKFGFTLSLGRTEEARRAVARCDDLELVGLHAHVGSQVFGTDPFASNAEILVELLADWRDEHGMQLGELNLGGGMGIRYTHEDLPAPAERYAEDTRRALETACAAHDLAVPRLFVEPGRAIVGPSTLTLYAVGTVKHLPGIRTYVSVDGGMSDNIRPALYGAEHEVTVAGRPVGDPDSHEAVTVVGKHCESGDLVRERVGLPADVAPGDLLAVAATGAYTEAMASNYNRLPRPGAVIVRDGRVRELLRRETYEDVIRRDRRLW